MKYVQHFLAFWYHFIVGDDWRIGVGVVFGLGLSAFLVHAVHIQVWWLLPVMVVVMLTISLLLTTRRIVKI